MNTSIDSRRTRMVFLHVLIAFWFSMGLVAIGWAQASPSNDQAQEASSNIGLSSVNMVASVHPIATEAGLKAMEQGGNAIDAAIATALTLGVVDGFNSGIGGGCFILIRTAEGELIAIDGREKAPEAAHRDMYLRNGVADPQLSQTGALAIGIPGALAAYHEAASQFGQKKFADLILPAAEIAENGFSISAGYQSRILGEQVALRKFPGSAAVLLMPDGSVPAVGHVLVQTDLAKTYRNIASEGTDWFYRGPFAAELEAWSKKNGGLITARDFANYRTVRRTPLRTQYRGFEVVGFPPPSSGGVHVGQILNILENFELKNSTAAERQAALHIVAEAMKLAFADRAHWLGDPDHINVPKGLIDKEYAKRLAQMISREKAALVKSHGTPPNHLDQFFEKHTTHIATADSAGNWVAITTTLNTSFGSKVIVPGLGVMMNNQMDDFSIAPGVPNAFGLIGGENNAVASGKRPLSSMSPTIILKDGQPVLTIGAAGGPTIITQVVCSIIQHLDFGLPIDEAIAAARIHHQWSPPKLLVENSLTPQAIDYLKRRGHELVVISGLGATQAIAFDQKTRKFMGVADPRVGGGSASGRLGDPNSDEEGFASLFDGESFEGWEGNLKYFRIEEGAIVAGDLKQPIPNNEFLCTKSEYSDFELRFEARLAGPEDNAGVQFRSQRIPGNHEVKGYQCDIGMIGGGRSVWGALYDESRRNRFLFEAPVESVKLIKPGEWNAMRVVAQGPKIQIFVNDHLITDYEEQESGIDLHGVIGLQIHSGPPAEAWYRNIRLKEFAK